MEEGRERRLQRQPGFDLAGEPDTALTLAHAQTILYTSN